MHRGSRNKLEIMLDIYSIYNYHESFDTIILNHRCFFLVDLQLIHPNHVLIHKLLLLLHLFVSHFFNENKKLN